MKIAFYTLGCRLNFAESSGMAQQFADKGWQVVDFAEPADWYVVNTCTVTAAAEKKCRQIIHQAHRTNGSAHIAVVGCFSALRPEEVKRLQGVDIVLGTHNKHLLLDYLNREGDRIGGGAGFTAAVSAGTTAASPDIFVPSYSTVGRTRSFFKVQDGCNNFCSYCAIPYARGRSRSNTVAQTVQTAKEIAAKGVKEMVLTGVNIGDFGRTHGENFYQLLCALQQIPDINRIRIGSVEPDLLSDEIIDLIAGSDKLMPHFHIPLQAAHNDVLKKMRRHYTREQYAERVGRIREKIPRGFIACDLIVGFPTETSEQFEEGYKFVEGLDLSALHVFSYSHRAEALASKIPYEYDVKEKAERSTRMHVLSDRKKEIFYKKFEGTEQKVLWEWDGEPGEENTGNAASRLMFGYTPNYLRVCAPLQMSLVNTIQNVRLGCAFKDADKDWCLEAVSSAVPVPPQKAVR